MASLLEMLGDSIEVATPDEHQRTFMDTFDGRIRRNGGQLWREGAPLERLVWSRASGNIPTLSLVQSQSGTRLFAWNLAAGPKRDALEKVIEMRALLPLFRLTTQRTKVSLLNRDQKTVVRLDFEENRVRPPRGRRDRRLLDTIVVSGLRGYDKAFRRVDNLLRRQLELNSVNESLLLRGLRALGKTPDDYTAKLTLTLEPDERADAATRALLRGLFDTMKANQTGMLSDLDSEFLHDFRVATRRTRSALSQIKFVFQEPELQHFKGEFRWLGQTTSLTRDLDVWLLNLRHYRSLFSESVQADFGLFEDYLKRSQRSAQADMAEALRADRYQKLLTEWDAFLARETSPRSTLANAVRPISAVARERISKAYKRVLKQGRAITRTTPAAAVHELRISCKKLRYLMEFFRSLFPSPEIGSLIKALKQLQKILGDFNDCEVQQASLARFADDLMASSNRPQAATLLAMGRLADVLSERQASARRHFHDGFDRFADRANRALAKRLFGKSKKRAGRRR